MSQTPTDDMVDAARFTLSGICGFEITAQTVRKALESALAVAPAPAELSVGAEPKRWLAEWTLPGGSIRWHVFEHEHQARTFQSGQPENRRVIALYDHPAPAEHVWGEAKAEDCVLSIGSQRVCAHGTLGCVNHHAPAPTVDVESEIASVVQSVNEWDDRTSPDDYPEHLLITSEELALILRNFAAALSSSEGQSNA